jgi:phage gp36-like protein
MSYLTKEDAPLYFSNITEFESVQIEKALEKACSLVNSFLHPDIPLPAIAADGTIPGILTIAQARFTQWILESANQGYTEELQNLYQSTASMLAKLTNEELKLSEVKNKPNSAIHQAEILY